MFNFSIIDFHWPWIFVLLPLPLLVGRNKKVARTPALRIPPRLAQALNHSSIQGRSDYIWQSLLLWLSWIMLLCAIGQPVIPGDVFAQPSSGRSLSLVIDLSASMERRDFIVDGENVDRLTVVKRVAGEFLQARTGDRIGLVLFGSEAFIASPPTFDLDAVRNVLNSSGSGMAGRTTAIGNALGLAIRTLKDDPANDKTIVLLSDGTNNAGTAEPESAAKLAQQLGIRIHTIGLGSDANSQTQSNLLHTSASADLDEATLRTIATAADGKFFRAHTTDELQTIYQEIDNLEQTPSTAPPVVVNQDIRNLFVLSLIVLMIFQGLLMRRSEAHR